MGGNVSLPKPLGAELMASLTKEYEQLSGLGYGDMVIQEKLEAKYQEFMTTKVPEAEAATATVTQSDTLSTTSSESVPVVATLEPAPVPVPAPAPKAAAAARGGKKGAKRSTAAPTRRRSFEGQPNKATVASPAQAMLNSASEEVLPPTSTTPPSDLTKTGSGDPAPGPPAATLPDAAIVQEVDSKKRDNWDSVNDMPYCDICKTAFKSSGLLDRHIKYSELHTKNVEKQAAAAAAAEGMANSPEVEINKTAIEGVDYKLTYFGSKFFWRSQDNIDLSFFHHFKICDCIEIVPFNPSKNKALPRLYLDYQKLLKLIQNDIHIAKQNATKAHALKSKFTQPKVDDDELIRKTLTSSLLSRLNLDINTNAGHTTTRVISYSNNVSDIVTDTPLLNMPPSGLVPVIVSHRRNTSSEEVQAKIADLEISKAELAKATSRAEQVINHVQSFAKRVKAEFLARSKMSIPRKRWVLAINRVLQINGVAKTTKFLQELAMKKMEDLSSQNGKVIPRRGQRKSQG